MRKAFCRTKDRTQNRRDDYSALRHRCAGRSFVFPQIHLQLYANLNLDGDYRPLVCIIRRKSSDLFLNGSTPLDIAVALPAMQAQPEDLKCAYRTICIPPLKYTTNVPDLLRVFIFPVFIFVHSVCVRGEIQPVLLDFHAAIWHETTRRLIKIISLKFLKEFLSKFKNI